MVVLLFISCNVIALVLNVFEETLQEHLEWRINYLVDVSNLLVVFNSSFNFIIYYNFSKTFKRCFLSHFFPTRNTKNQRSGCSRLVVKNGNNHIPPTNAVLLTTTRLSEPMTSFTYACESSGTNSELNGHVSDRATIASTSDLSNVIINNNNTNRHDSVSKLFGLSRTEVLIWIKKKIIKQFHI